MIDDSFLTTFDNPFNPFSQFESWWKRDLLLGHDCCGLLARTSNVSDVANDDVNDKAIIDAMNEIVKNEPLIYKIVKPSDFDEQN